MKRTILLLGVLGYLAWGDTIVRVGSQIAFQSSQGHNSLAVNYTATTGNTLIFFCNSYNSAATTYTATAADGINSYVQDISQQSEQSGSVPGQSQLFLFHASNVTGGLLTITCTLGVGQTADLTVIVVEYSGLKGTTQPDVTASNAGPDHAAVHTLVFSSPSITPLSNDLLVSAFNTNDQIANTYAVSTGWTIVQQQSWLGSTACAYADQIINAPGSYNITVTNTVSSPAGTGWATGIVGYKNATPAVSVFNSLFYSIP